MTVVTVCALSNASRDAMTAALDAAGMLAEPAEPVTLASQIAADLAASGPGQAAKAATEQATAPTSHRNTTIAIKVRGRGECDVSPAPERSIYTWTNRGTSKYGEYLGALVGSGDFVVRAWSEKRNGCVGPAFVLTDPTGWRKIGGVSEPIAPPAAPATDPAAPKLVAAAERVNDNAVAVVASDLLAQGLAAGAGVADQLAAHGYKPAPASTAPFQFVLADPTANMIIRRKSDNFPVVFLSVSKKGKQALDGSHPRYKASPGLRPVPITA